MLAAVRGRLWLVGLAVCCFASFPLTFFRIRALRARFEVPRLEDCCSVTDSTYAVQHVTCNFHWLPYFKDASQRSLGTTSPSKDVCPCVFWQAGSSVLLFGWEEIPKKLTRDDHA